MKKIITSLLILLTVLYACTYSGKNSLITKPGDMPADEYTIDTERDTILVTKNGALLKIPQGAIDAGSKKQDRTELCPANSGLRHAFGRVVGIDQNTDRPARSAQRFSQLLIPVIEATAADYRERQTLANVFTASELVTVAAFHTACPGAQAAA